MFCKRGVLRNFTKFTGKHLCQSLFLSKVAGLRPQACSFIKKKTLVQVFSWEFCEVSKNTFLYRTYKEEDIQDVFLTFNVRSIYVLCPEGAPPIKKSTFHIFVSFQGNMLPAFFWLFWSLYVTNFYGNCNSLLLH